MVMRNPDLILYLISLEIFLSHSYNYFTQVHKETSKKYLTLFNEIKKSTTEMPSMDVHEKLICSTNISSIF